MFAKIKKYYDMGIYTKEQVAVFVEKGKLTAKQYEEIVREPLAESEAGQESDSVGEE